MLRLRKYTKKSASKAQRSLLEDQITHRQGPEGSQTCAQKKNLAAQAEQEAEVKKPSLVKAIARLLFLMDGSSVGDCQRDGFGSSSSPTRSTVLDGRCSNMVGT